MKDGQADIQADGGRTEGLTSTNSHLCAGLDM